jgi:hypothetical protein
MSIARREEPLNNADRAALRKLAAQLPESSRFTLPLLGLVAGIAAVAAAFAVIDASAAVAVVLILVGTLLAVIGFSGVLAAGLRRRVRRDIRSDLQQIEEAQTVAVTEIQIDAAWNVEPFDEDCSALLLRIAPDRYLYCNSPWVDDLLRLSPEAFPRTVTLRTAGSYVLSTTWSGPSVPLVDAGDDEEDLQILPPNAGVSLIELPFDALPQAWKVRVFRAAPSMEAHC